MGIDNEGEDWAYVDNEGEDWSTNKPTNAPFPRPPTTNSPTIDLLGRLEDLQETYYCAVSWDQIDCDNAIPCPSGDAKGEVFLIVIVSCKSITLSLNVFKLIHRVPEKKYVVL